MKKTYFLIPFLVFFTIDFFVSLGIKSFVDQNFFIHMYEKIFPKHALPEFPVDYRIGHPHYHHDLKPMVEDAPAIWGDHIFKMTTNSLGFRDRLARKISLKALPREHRILFIGDSFTESLGVNFEDSFIGIFEQKLNLFFHEKNSPIQIHALNAGVSSYSPLIYLKKVQWLLDHGLEFKEVFVFLDLSDCDDEGGHYREGKSGEVIKITDLPNQARAMMDSLEVQKVQKTEKRPENVGATEQNVIAPSPFKREAGNIVEQSRENLNDLRKQWKNQAKEFFKNHLFLSYTPFFIAEIRTQKRRIKENFGIKKSRALWTLQEPYKSKCLEDGIPRMKKSMNELHNLLKSKGISLSLAIYPWPDQIYNHDLNSLHAEIWEDWANNKGVLFLNLFPVFIDFSEEKSHEWIGENKLRPLFIASDVHWSKKGHAVVAKALYDFYQTTL